MTNSTATQDISLDPTAPSTPSRARRRALAAVMTGALAATLGLGALAPAADAAMRLPTVGVVKVGPINPGPSLSLSSTPGTGVIKASGSGFSSGATIRLDVSYPTTGDLQIGAAQVTATRTRMILNPLTMKATTIAGGSFSANITVPSSEFRNCWNGDTFYVRAVQLSPVMQTAFQPVLVHWATFC